MGFAIAHPSVQPLILAAHDPVYIAVNWAQYALARYITQHYDDYERHVAAVGRIMQANWRILSQALHECIGWVPIEPDGSMYGLFRHQCASDLDALRLGLDHGIGVAGGSMFFGGDPAQTGLIRIHYGFSTETAQAIADTVRHKAAERRQASAASAASSAASSSATSSATIPGQ